jgi:molecular chaperone DnaK
VRRTAVDFGIDLGTTNSCVAVFDGKEARVIRNNEGAEYTPSVVWIDKNGDIFVGEAAKQRMFYDEGNVKCEFKLLMGESTKLHFEDSGRDMTPEELSAEVLKSLRSDVQRSLGEEIFEAVICVPADFGAAQCEATKKAAELAGFRNVHILQEPSAAGIAYGFQEETGDIYWLVYDLGGGTFDAALIRVQEGRIRVVNHKGDKHLGGKLIDWDIVDKVFIPALKKEGYALSSFNRASPDRRWAGAFAKLKLEAERAKIRLSRDERAPVLIDPLCQDEKGNWVSFSYNLTREELEPIIEPYIVRTVNLVKDLLNEAGLKAGDIAKIVLVGGPTMTPLLREMLTQEFGIPLEYTIDPLTVVARGAAIFAGTLPRSIDDEPVPPGAYRLEWLVCEPMGNELKPKFIGKVIAPNGSSLRGLTIEFKHSKTHWRSGLISLQPDGTFEVELEAEPECRNEFSIELRSDKGTIMYLSPNTIQYTHTYQPPIPTHTLIHSIGVALANGEMLVFVEKGTDLPAKRRKLCYTIADIERGESGTFVRIPVLEGENTRRADRNRVIGELRIDGKQVQRDVPAGSEIEITIEIDESRLIKTKAYIPILNQEYENVIDLKRKEALSIDRLEKELNDEKKRYNELREEASWLRGQILELGDGISRVIDRTQLVASIDDTLERIEDKIAREQIFEQIESALSAARGGDIDALQRCDSRLLDLKVAIDEIDNALLWPRLVVNAQNGLNFAYEIVGKYGNKDEKDTLDRLKNSLIRDLRTRDLDLIDSAVSRIVQLALEVMPTPEYLVVVFQIYEERFKQGEGVIDPDLVQQLIDQGYKAINNNDLNGLKDVVGRLGKLFQRPTPPSEVIISHIIKK